MCKTASTMGLIEQSETTFTIIPESVKTLSHEELLYALEDRFVPKEINDISVLAKQISFLISIKNPKSGATSFVSANCAFALLEKNQYLLSEGRIKLSLKHTLDRFRQEGNANERRIAERFYYLIQ